MKTSFTLTVAMMGVLSGCFPREIDLGGLGNGGEDAVGGESSFASGGTTPGTGGGRADASGGVTGTPEEYGEAGQASSVGGGPFVSGSTGGSSTGGHSAGEPDQGYGGEPGSGTGGAYTSGSGGSGGYEEYGGEQGSVGGGPVGTGGAYSYGGRSEGSGGSGTTGIDCFRQVVATFNGCENDEIFLPRATEVCAGGQAELTSVEFSGSCDDPGTFRDMIVVCCSSESAGATGGSAGAAPGEGSGGFAAGERGE